MGTSILILGPILLFIVGGGTVVYSMQTAPKGQPNPVVFYGGLALLLSAALSAFMVVL